MRLHIVEKMNMVLKQQKACLLLERNTGLS